jgi:hypothetical protein
MKNQKLSEIIPRHVDGHSCIEDSIAIISAFYGRDYAMMFEGIWGFGFTPAAETVGGGISLPSADPQRLEQYHGISLNFMQVSDVKEAFSLVKQELVCSRPVGVVLDAYFSPWHPSYQVDHILTHLVIVSEIDDSDNLICTCGDPMLFGVPLCFESFTEAVSGVVLFEAKEQFQKPQNTRLHIYNALKCNSENGQENIINFAEKLAELSDISNELSTVSDYLNAPLINGVLEAGRTRLKFAEFLDYLYANVENDVWIAEAATDFRKAASMWNFARNSIIRSLVSKNMSMLSSTVKKALVETAEFENIVSQRLTQLCQA